MFTFLSVTLYFLMFDSIYCILYICNRITVLLVDVTKQSVPIKRKRLYSEEEEDMAAKNKRECLFVVCCS